MVNVNLIGRRRRAAQGRNWILLTLIGLFTIFVIYFLSASIYVIVKLTLIRNEQSAINREIENVSGEITANDELLRGFILSKHILGRIDELNSGKFPYKEYLDQLVTFVPEGGLLRNVDFSNRGWVAVAITLPNVRSLGVLEENLKDTTKLAASPFSSVFTENVTKDRTGTYSARLQFEIRKNGS